MVHAQFIRSPYAHARIVDIDASAARGKVLLTATGDDIANNTSPRFDLFVPDLATKVDDYCLAYKKAVYSGQPVAVVVAESKYAAVDAAESIKVEYEPLEPITDPLISMRPETRSIHERVGSNLGFRKVFNYGDVESSFNSADYIVKERLRWHRFSSTPIECFGVIADYDKRHDTLTIISNNQRPAQCQTYVARALRMDGEKIRTITPDIGGAFGIKADNYGYITTISYLSRQLGRPVKFVETRTEHMLAGTHGNDITCDAEMAVKKNGKILGLRLKLIHDVGAFLRREPLGALNMITKQGTSVYRIDTLQADVNCVFTNKSTVASNRSYGKMQQCWIIERMIDKAARLLHIDPTEMRLLNLIDSPKQAYVTVTGSILDGGDYPYALRKVLELLDYEQWKRQQAEMRKKGKYIGIGVGFGVDANPSNFAIARLIDPVKMKMSGDSEAATIKIAPNGKIVVATGSVPQGQGHETTISQVVADELAVTPDDVYVLPGFDSSTHPFTPFSGTYASRFSVMSLGAIKGATKKIRDKVLDIASSQLEVSKDDLELDNAQITVKGTNKSISLKQVAATAWGDLALLPKGMEPGVQATFVYSPEYALPAKNGTVNLSLTYLYSVHAAVVEIDGETGELHVLKYAAVSDPGHQINPLIVEGQLQGYYAHQVGATLLEKFVYDENGQLLTSNFADYAVPTAVEIPDHESFTLENPSLFSAYGTRGCGEGGGSPISALTSAIENALEPLGISINSSHVTNQDIFRLMSDSRRNSKKPSS
jgi:CO/xanthine dehydrogenase Mo-binding subunit